MTQYKTINKNTLQKLDIVYYQNISTKYAVLLDFCGKICYTILKKRR